MTAAAVTAEIPAAAETPAEAGGVTSGTAVTAVRAAAVPAVVPTVTMATTGIREAAEMTTELRTATAAGVKTAAARTTIQARTGGTGCSGRDVGSTWRIART